MSIENVICTKEEQLKENLEKIKSDMAYPAMTENELKENIDYVSETFDEQEEVRLSIICTFLFFLFVYARTKRK